MQQYEKIMQQYEKDHLAKVLDNAAECTVLLKSNGQFPIEGPCKLAAYGAGVRYTVKGGTGSGEVNSRFTYTIEQGLEREGFEITTKAWLDEYDKIRAEAKKTFYKKIKAQARAKHENAIIYSMGKEMLEPYYDMELSGKGDAAIYVVSRNSGEGSDRRAVRGDVRLTKSEIRDILKLNRRYDRFMLVLNVGGVVDLSPVMKVHNILLLSQLGVDCGKVLADIMTGKQNPSGKLSTTWAAYDDYCGVGTFGDWNETRYKEGIYVGYRYFDTFGKKALFPFGYGLSYTSFKQNVLSVTAEADTIYVKAEVKNIGAYAGKEVVQVYVSLPAGRLDKAYQELAGFAKTPSLAPGEACQVDITFTLSDFASYDEKAEAYILEAGDYIVRVGNSSISTAVAAVVSLDETVVTLKVRNCLGSPDFLDMKPNGGAAGTVSADVISADADIVAEVPVATAFVDAISTDAISADVNSADADTVAAASVNVTSANTASANVTSTAAVRLSVRASEIKTATVEYDKTYDIDKKVKKLSDEELVYLAIGGFNPNAKGLGVIGNAAVHVAGAAGETTSQLEHKGIKPLIMADGPAGLRLCKNYYEDENGAHGANESSLPASMSEMMGPVVRFIAELVMGGGKKIPKNAVIKEQAATMIPIGTAVAQSFNTELAREFGNIVGTEMEMFGVNLWLAPALNIHRSILCGRNFEYYSEDPLLSGFMAAAVTSGVQSHTGCGTTIKHYAANNAETNRYCNNSQVSERAMREIYLRGFGIAVRNSQPLAVMTSYNLLNGTHTAEHRGLIEDVLRCEYGFEGIVMTDWVIEMMTSKKSVYRNSYAPEVVKAGGDLFMPGGKKDYNKVLSALKNGEISRKQLEINATRVVRMEEKLQSHRRKNL